MYMYNSSYKIFPHEMYTFLTKKITIYDDYIHCIVHVYQCILYLAGIVLTCYRVRSTQTPSMPTCGSYYCSLEIPC